MKKGCKPYKVNSKNSYTSTKNFLLAKGLIDKFLNIIDYNNFKKEVASLTKLAKDKHGINEGPLFGERTISSADKSYYQAVANKKAFNKIDGIKKKAQPKQELTDYYMGDNALREQEQRELGKEVVYSKSPVLSDISRLGTLEGDLMAVEKGAIGVNKQQLMMLLGPSMYNKPLAQVAVKELLQNSFDAVKARQNSQKKKTTREVKAIKYAVNIPHPKKLTVKEYEIEYKFKYLYRSKDTKEDLFSASEPYIEDQDHYDEELAWAYNAYLDDYNRTIADIETTEAANAAPSVEQLESVDESGVTPGNIDIDINAQKRTISIRDDGMGMTTDIVKNAFLSIGGTSKEGLSAGERSGGLGLAKVQFLLGSESVHVITVRDGIKTEIQATGIQLYNDDFEIHTSETSEPNGSFVEVKIPQSYTTLEGATRTIDFPGSYGGWKSYDILNKPLIGNVDVEVSYTNDYGKTTTEMVPIGRNSTEATLPPFFSKITFDWGEAELYMSIDRSENSKHRILSAGIYQFDYSFKNSQYEKVPYDIVVNIKPNVKAGAEQYPFNNQREGFKPTVERDISSLNKYLLKYASGEAEKEGQANFKNILALPKIDPNKVLTPEEKAKLLSIVDERLKEISEGQIKPVDDGPRRVTNIIIRAGSVTDRDTGEVAVKEKEFESSFGAERKLEELAPLDISGFDDTQPQFHNNTNVDYFQVEGATTFFTELGSTIHQIVKEFGGDYLGHNESSSYRKLMGKRSGEDAPSYFAGISIDKGYHGIHTYKPFKAIFINPLSYSSNNVEDLTYKFLMTTLHEIVHTKEANHEYDGFGRELQNIIGVFFASPRAELYTGLLRSVFKRNLSTYEKLRNIYEKSTTKNNSKSFEGQEDSAESGSINDRSRIDTEKGTEVSKGDDSASTGGLGDTESLGDIILSKFSPDIKNQDLFLHLSSELNNKLNFSNPGYNAGPTVQDLINQMPMITKADIDNKKLEC